MNRAVRENEGRKGKASVRTSASDRVIVMNSDEITVGGHRWMRADFVAQLVSMFDHLIVNCHQTDVHSIDPSDLAIFIYNKGDDTDRLDSIIRLIPIAKRIYERINESEKAQQVQNSGRDRS